MVAVDHLEVQDLAAADAVGHRAEHDARADPGRGVPRVVRVRQGRDDEVVEARGRGREARAREGQVREGDPADAPAGQLAAREGLEPGADLPLQARPEGRGAQGAAQHLVAGGGDVERLAQERLELLDVDAAVLQDLRERVVLLLGALHPEDVVEEQLGAVARRDALELAARPVHEHPPQLTDLRPDGAELRVRGGGGLHARRTLAPRAAAEPRTRPAGAPRASRRSAARGPMWCGRPRIGPLGAPRALRRAGGAPREGRCGAGGPGSALSRFPAGRERAAGSRGRLLSRGARPSRGGRRGARRGSPRPRG